MVFLAYVGNRAPQADILTLIQTAGGKQVYNFTLRILELKSQFFPEPRLPAQTQDGPKVIQKQLSAGDSRE